jgi:hypothetical protein
VAVAELNRLRDGAMGACPFKDGFDRLIDGSTFTVAADNSHDIPAHISPRVCRHLTTKLNPLL